MIHNENIYNDDLLEYTENIKLLDHLDKLGIVEKKVSSDGVVTYTVKVNGSEIDITSLTGTGSSSNPFLVSSLDNVDLGDIDEDTRITIDFGDSYTDFTNSKSVLGQIPLIEINFGKITNENCASIFWGFGLLTKVSGDLTNVTDGSGMFYDCKLTDFNIALPNLTNGNSMFYRNELTSWNIELPKLVEGTGMFAHCANLETFESNTPNLETSGSMLSNCTSLKSCTINLTSCYNMYSMFAGDTALKEVVFLEGEPGSKANSQIRISCCDMFEECSSLESLDFGSTPISITTEMFKKCSSLKTVKVALTNDATYNNMFDKYCTSLEEVYITTDIEGLTKEKLGITSTTAKLYINGVEV